MIIWRAVELMKSEDKLVSTGALKELDSVLRTLCSLLIILLSSSSPIPPLIQPASHQRFPRDLLYAGTSVRFWDGKYRLEEPPISRLSVLTDLSNTMASLLQSVSFGEIRLQEQMTPQTAVVYNSQILFLPHIT